MEELRLSIFEMKTSTPRMITKIIIADMDERSDYHADIFRVEGNKYFEDKNWEKSMDLYTKSACFSLNKKLKGMALGNRSACFLAHKHVR